MLSLCFSTFSVASYIVTAQYIQYSIVKIDTLRYSYTTLASNNLKT